MTGAGELVERAVREAGHERRAAFIPFLMAGYPNAEVFLELALALADCGADLLEIGLPAGRSPLDGPDVRLAARTARAHGVDQERGLDLASRAKRLTGLPLVIMTYAAPLRKHGVHGFAARVRDAGGDGVIMPNVPAGKAGAWNRAAQAAGVAAIPLLRTDMPTADRDRLIDDGNGFAYLAASTGPTGGRLAVDDGLIGRIRAIRERSALPVAVGFGVSDAAAAGSLAPVADAVVVGSALIRKMAADDNGGPVSAAAALAGNIRAALNRGRRKPCAGAYTPPAAEGPGGPSNSPH